MKKTEILTIPNPILRQKSKEIAKVDKSVGAIIDRMVFAIEGEEIGLGLAAPQIGESVRIIVIKSREIVDENGNVLQKEIPTTVFVNPTITKFSKEKTVVEEGCLSYMGYFGPVERPKKIKLEALDDKGRRVKINAGGLLARVVQHEVDHLDGILFIDRVQDKSKIKRSDVEDVREERNKKL